MKTNDIRTKFLAYMKEKGHAVVPSASLLPENDPTTLFTGSGMQPMLPYLLGQPHPLGKRVADSQKCFRSQDIEEVGDNRHTTFFEMLGNWSFGDYFKQEEITWMFNFFVKEYNLNLNNFYVTCFAGNETLGVPKDTFSTELWQKLFKEQGLTVSIGEHPEKDGIRTIDGVADHIFYYSEKKNWWSRSGVPAKMPEGEPGGPDTEMFYDFDPLLENGKHAHGIHEKSAWKNDVCHPNCDCGRFMEIGNNVFMQYKKTARGFEELPQMNVDHGSGLERWVAAIRNDADMFNIDVFDDAKKILENISGLPYVSDVAVTYTDLKNPTFAYRVILDHTRAAMFLIGDGVFPGNKDQMYFVRRLIRRAVRYAKNIGITDTFMSKVAEAFIEYYKDEYSILAEKRAVIVEEINKEEVKFRKTLENGIKQFERVSDGNVSGANAFDLLQTYGFPIELTEELAKEKGISVDRETFDILKKEHSDSSRTASEGKFKGGLGGDSEMEVKYHTATHMLHQALREVLGESVAQKGSNITPERLRFDFSFDRKMTDEEKKKVEDIINARIKENLPVIREEVSMDEARARGAIGLFGDKYGDVVSIYRIGEGKNRGDSNLFSMEFCGGPHVNSTGDLAVGGIHPDDSSRSDNGSDGPFKIVKEEAVSQGVRRIKAVLQ
jgi:alanyl-tRNA synthetase